MSPLSTSPSNAAVLRSFLARLLAFAAPLALGVGLFEWQIYRTGESLSVQVYVRQYGDCADVPLVIARKYFSQQFNLYHMAMMRHRHPSIVAIGSSRVGALRSRMFYPHHAGFYTAPNFIYCVEDIDGYVGLIESGYLKKPQALIVGLDPWWLNAARKSNPWIRADVTDDVYSFTAHVSVFRRYMAALAAGRSPPQGLPKEHYAIADANPPVDQPIAPFSYTNYVDRENPPIIERIRTRTKQFVGFSEIDPCRLRILFHALTRLRNAGVQVAVIEPPFSSEVVRLLEDNPERYPWWKQYRDWLPNEFAKRGFVCVRASSPTELGLADAPHMYDGFHADASYMTYLVEDLVRRSPTNSTLASVSLDHLRGLRLVPTADKKEAEAAP